TRRRWSGSSASTRTTRPTHPGARPEPRRAAPHGPTPGRTADVREPCAAGVKSVRVRQVPPSVVVRVMTASGPAVRNLHGGQMHDGHAPDFKMAIEYGPCGETRVALTGELDIANLSRLRRVLLGVLEECARIAG